MPRNYEYLEISIDDLLLDEENPRFASSILVKGNNSKISQDLVIEHLLRYADIIKLATRINQVGELHGSEVVTCYKKGKKYIVLEGNRRICACKLLLDRKLIPDDYKNNFPFIESGIRNNIEHITVAVYPTRESVQAFLSDRHITGVKKWSALEKNNYYMNLFENYKSLDEVKKYTSDTLNKVADCIKRYQFFMSVFRVLKTRYANIEIEKLDYLPMVDRFMDTLVGNDLEVGLNLAFDEEKLLYIYDSGKSDIYTKILMFVGEAFLIRREKKYSGDELSKIVASEIYSTSNQKKLILDNVRIPGLIDLIKQYKGHTEAAVSQSEDEISESQDTSNMNPDNRQESDSKGSSNEGAEGGNKDTTIENFDNEKIDLQNGIYSPHTKYKPKRTKLEYLYFTKEEASNFKINTESDYDEKIRSLLSDMNNFSIYKHPYTVALLYRTLLEICTRRVYFVASVKISKEHNESDLKQSMLYLANNILLKERTGKDIPKIREAIKNYLSNIDLIQILNLYIHYSNPVDENIILSSWSSMKKYIQFCLEVE